MIRIENNVTGIPCLEPGIQELFSKTTLKYQTETIERHFIYCFFFQTTLVF